jgi:hypothetical protein
MTLCVVWAASAAVRKMASLAALDCLGFPAVRNTELVYNTFYSLAKIATST